VETADPDCLFPQFLDLARGRALIVDDANRSFFGDLPLELDTGQPLTLANALNPSH
jgi:hypothetical protein